MKLGIISDIHVDINKDYPILEELINQVNASKIDVLLIAGDISETVSETISSIQTLTKNTSAKIYFVPGNHDMWGKDYPQNSTALIYQKYKTMPECISEKNILLNDEISLIGNIGWYDYSFGNDKYRFDDFEKMTCNERTWQDKLFNEWSKDNTATNNWQLETLDEAYKINSSSTTILMTHMVSHTSFTVPLDWSTKIDWGYFNAFLGSRALTDFCDNKKIDIAIMGHVHYRGTYKENNTLYICSCLNYHTEWQSTDYKKEISDALYILTI